MEKMKSLFHFIFMDYCFLTMVSNHELNKHLYFARGVGVMPSIGISVCCYSCCNNIQLLSKQQDIFTLAQGSSACIW